MALAMAGSRCAVGQLRESLPSFRGDGGVRGFVRQSSSGVGFADRSHESFYALRVRCGKKEKSLAVKVAKVQQLVRVQRDLVMSSQNMNVAVEPESSIQIGIGNPVLDRIIKNLQDLQAEVESINVKAKKKKGSSSSSSSSSSSCSSSSESDTGKANMKSLMAKKRKKSSSSTSSSSSSSSSSSESDRGKAMDMRGLRKNNFVKHMGDLPARSVVADNAISSRAPVETVSSAKTTGVVTSPTAEFVATRGSVSSSGEEEPAIVSQIRALCSTAIVSSPADIGDIFSRGPIELKDTQSGRVIMNPALPSLPSVAVSVPKDATPASSSGKIEVCTVGKCRRGGSQQILASLQASIPESSNISVTSCKCMGKCKTAPNVRVKNSEGQTQLLSHVSVDDFGTLLEFHFGLQPPNSTIPNLHARYDSDCAAAA